LNQATRHVEVGAKTEFVSKMPDPATQRHRVGDLGATVVIKIVAKRLNNADGEIALDLRGTMREAPFSERNTDTNSPRRVAKSA